MEVEFVMSGICSFINMRNKDEKILEPSVILLNATHETLGSHGPAPPPNEGDSVEDEGGVEGEGHEGHTEGAAEGEDAAEGGAAAHDHDHIPYLAYDSRLVAVEPSAGFEVPEHAESFRFLRLDGVEVTIDGHDIGVPIIDPTFDNVVDRELYWPESQGLWNPDAVPPRGSQPKKTAVKALMRFAHGKIFGGRLCPFKWKFTKLDGDSFARHFAEEVIYTYSETEDDSVVVKLLDLENPDRDPDADNPTFTFRPVGHQSKVTLFLGNSIKDDMDTSLRRQRSKRATEAEPVTGTHFRFFDAIVDVGERDIPGPPEPMLPKGDVQANAGEPIGGGGTDGGICGPKRG